MGAPVNLGSPINTSALEQGATLWHGGHVLFFSSDRPDPDAPPGAPTGDGCGPAAAPVIGASCDIWMSERRDVTDDQAWDQPSRLGPPVNTREYSEAMGDIREDESTGAIELYFSRTRPRGPGAAPDHDIYVARTDSDGRFGEPELIEEVSSDAQDQRVTVSPDGLVMMFQSTRRGGAYCDVTAPTCSSDLWMSTRESTTGRASEVPRSAARRRRRAADRPSAGAARPLRSLDLRRSRPCPTPSRTPSRTTTAGAAGP